MFKQKYVRVLLNGFITQSKILTPQEFESVVKRERELCNKNPWREKSTWRLALDSELQICKQ